MMTADSSIMMMNSNKSVTVNSFHLHSFLKPPRKSKKVGASFALNLQARTVQLSRSPCGLARHRVFD
jgi:hypothetical protein